MFGSPLAGYSVLILEWRALSPVQERCFMSNRDYIPSGDEQFLDWAQNFLTYAASRAAAWGIADSKVAALQALKVVYAEKLAAAKAPNRGKADVLAKNEARDALEGAVRPFYKSHIAYNEDVTDEDRVKMGVPVHNNKHSPVPPPATHPDFEIDTSELRQLTIHFRDEGSTHRGKPDGVHGAEICWEFLNAPPEKIEDLKR
jgi:hypothetical protein